jgi:hypothetical protein
VCSCYGLSEVQCKTEVWFMHAFVDLRSYSQIHLRFASSSALGLVTWFGFF